MAKRSNREEMRERLDETERAMIRMRSTYRVHNYLREKYSVTERTGDNWMAKVRKRWAAQREANPERAELRELRRDEARALLNEAIVMAGAKTTVVRNPDGTAVLDGAGNPIRVQSPDVQRMLYAVAQLRALDGLDAPVKMRVDGGNASGVLVVGVQTGSHADWAAKFGERTIGGGEPPPSAGDDDDDAEVDEAVVEDDGGVAEEN